jgi:hypothetical protein
MHGPLDLAIRDRTHVAQLLGQDEVRVESLELRLVERVDAASGVQRASDVAVDLTAVAPTMAKCARGHRGQARRLRRVVALVGDAHQPSTQAKGEHDLGRAGQERADAQRLGHRRLG